MRKSRVVGLTALAAAAALVICRLQRHAGPGGRQHHGRPGRIVGQCGRQQRSKCRQPMPRRCPVPRMSARSAASGCGIPHGPYEEPATKGGEVRVAWNDPPLSFNNNTTHGNAIANANIMYLTNTGFTYYDQDLNLINNDQFGTCEIVSLDPLTVKYTVNEGVKWSDGVQIGAADMVLSWGAAERRVQRRGGQGRH